MRSLTGAMQTAITAASLQPVWLVDLLLATPQYHTTHWRELTWSARTYVNTQLMDIGDADESSTLQIPTLDIQLTGVDQAAISTAMLSNSIDREVVVWMGLLDANGAVIADPIEYFRGRIDGYDGTEGPGGADITWRVTHHFGDFDRVCGRRTNNDSQAVLFPGDLGFAFAAEKSEQTWGRK